MNKFYTNGKCNVQEVYYPLALLMGCGAVERHLEMAQPTKKKCFRRSLHDDCFCFQLQRYDSDVTLTSIIDKTPKISVSSIDFDQNGEWIDSNP